MSSMTNPIVKYDEAINGMVRVTMQNLNALYDPGDNYELTISYKFNFNNAKSSAWKSIKIPTNKISFQNEFYLKLPLHFLEYSIQIKSTIKVVELARNNDEITNTIESSKIDSIHIPSILLESQHMKGDRIQYVIPNSGYIHGMGVIMDISPNDNMVKVGKLSHSSLNDIVTLPISSIFRYPIRRRFVVDITDRTQAETNLILKTSDTNIINVYHTLCGRLYDFYLNEMRYVEIDRYHFEFMSKLMAVHIVKYLYNESYNYRIQCIFDDAYLCCQEQWKFHLSRDGSIAEGTHVQTARTLQDTISSTCDICRVEISFYDIMYYSLNENLNAFCLSCTHSIVKQYEEMKEFLSKILNNVFDNDCIQEILTFCIGDVSKFNVVNELLDKIDEIDNDVDVGSKRRIHMNDYQTDKKRQKLQRINFE